MTEDPPARDAIQKAAQFLRAGQLVAFPTETVYGLGADASSRAAIERLYKAKGRPSTHPVIVHLHDEKQIPEWAIDIPDSFYILAQAFWPGPMTVILKRAASVLDEVTGGQDTVGLRIPNHPLALDLLKEFGGGIVAPSANKFGRLSPTAARHVHDEFKNEIAMVLDGGSCKVGIESTIVDLTGVAPRILRPGMLSEESIFSALGLNNLAASKKPHSVESVSPSAESTEIRVPGDLASHYAPVTPVHLVSSDALHGFIERNRTELKSIAVISFQRMIAGFTPENWKMLPHDADAYAISIYATMRQLDELGCNLMIIELPRNGDAPESCLWKGILDRLHRAAHH